MKLMNSRSVLGTNRNNRSCYYEDLQRRPECEDAISCFYTYGLVYQVEALDHAIGLGMSRRAQPVLDAQMRGLGSMVAIEFRQPQTGQPDPAALQRVHAHWSRACCDSVVSCGLYGQVIRLLYPLTIEDTTFEKALTILANALEPGDFS